MKQIMMKKTGDFSLSTKTTRIAWFWRKLGWVNSKRTSPRDFNTFFDSQPTSETEVIEYSVGLEIKK